MSANIIVTVLCTAVKERECIAAVTKVVEASLNKPNKKILLTFEFTI